MVTIVPGWLFVTPISNWSWLASAVTMLVPRGAPRSPCPAPYAHAIVADRHRPGRGIGMLIHAGLATPVMGTCLARFERAHVDRPALLPRGDG